MSFLDATGLGTFWGKLKNYFVPKTNFVSPVTGLTSMLTPVNHLPNSDYSRTEQGYPTTIATLNSSFNTIRKYWQLQANNGSATNVTISYTAAAGNTKACITITGTIASVTESSAFSLRLRNNSVPLYRDSTLHRTVGFTAESTTHDYSLYVNFSGSAAIINNNGGNMVLRSTGIDTMPYFGISLSNCKVNDTFTVKYYSGYYYEGGFLNPPMDYSLDVRPGNQFTLKSSMDYARRLQVDTLSIKNVGNSEWFRVARLNDNDSSLDCIGEFFLSSTAGDNHRGKIHGSFAIYNSTYAGITVYSAYRISNSSVTLFSKLRIVKCTETDGSIGHYLEAYSNSSSNSNTYVNCVVKLTDTWMSDSFHLYNRQYNLGKVPSGITETAVGAETSVTYTAI